MPRRPAIPAEIRRQVAVASGHRCAVCGESWPLEFAHIIPWHICHQNTPEDLVYLCANCHERADKENWGEKTLRRYKQNPAVHRQSAAEERARAGQSVTLQIRITVEDFRERDSRLLRLTLAELFSISPEEVDVTRFVEENKLNSDG